ncbi:MAG: 50S ribosomal protein L25 [Candidatus Omnitrophota bacterium]
MEKVLLNAKERVCVGKTGSKQLRSQGQIPAVIYKGGKAGLNVQIDQKELWKALHTEAGHNAIISMDIRAGEKHFKRNVIVQAIQTDPVEDNIVHIDFHEISLTDKLKVKVPVVLKGEALEVKKDEGVLTQIMWEIEVECLPTGIPEHINVMIDKLRVGDVIQVKDIKFPADVKVLVDGEQVVVTASLPKAEEEKEDSVSEVDTGEPEVIKKGKKDEEDSEEAEPSSKKEEKS